jgi:hypothetical protein
MSILCGDIYAPYWATYQSGAPSFGNDTVDAESEKFAVIVPTPKTGTISKIHVICTTVSVAPTADYDIRLETVGSGTGDPTGTLLDTNTNGALTIIAFAVVFVPPASPDTGNVQWANYADGSYGFPYIDTYNGSVWAKQTGGPLVLLEYSDTSIPRIPNCFPWTITASDIFYSDSTTKHYGNRFKLREDTEIVGIWAVMDHDAPDSTITLYSGLATVEKTLTLKKHHTGGTGGSVSQYAGYFSSPFNASADTLYRLAAENNYATASGTPLTLHMLGISPLSIASSIWDHRPYAGLFSEIYRTRSDDLSSWTDSTINWFEMIGPIIRSIG